MDRKNINNLIRIGLVILINISIVYFLNSECAAQNTKERDGLKFQVPDDWPIERRGGIVAPIPVEEYLTIKFTAIDETLKVIKTEVTDELNTLKSTVENIDVKLSEEITKNNLPEGRKTSDPGLDATATLAKLKSFNDELSRVDRKIDERISEIKSGSGTVDQRLAVLEKSVKKLEKQISKMKEEIDYIFEHQGKGY